MGLNLPHGRRYLQVITFLRMVSLVYHYNRQQVKPCYAAVVEQADTRDLKSLDASHVGSNPTSRTSLLEGYPSLVEGDGLLNR